MAEANVRCPNILLILTDQQSAGALGAAGNPFVCTPAMDRLAATGARFEQAYCSYPTCVPARTSLLYGRMPHEIFLPGTEIDLAARPNDPARGIRPERRGEELGRLLGSAGYDCAYAGKWHVGQWGPTESLLDSFGSGFRPICPINDSLLPARCRDFFTAPRSRPFFLVASIDNPHNIHEWAVQAPLPWGNLPEPPALTALPPLPANFRSMPYEPGPVRVARNEQEVEYAYTPDDWRRYRWAYLRLVERADAVVGGILDALEAAGLASETLVIFTSDHGDQQGAHELAHKAVLYDESARVPLIVRGPQAGSGGAVCRRPVSAALDVYATICEAAGVAPPAGLRGQSLLDWVRRPDAARRPYVVAELTRPHHHVQARMVRSDRFKYIAYERGPWAEQLFDMRDDPGEMVNLATCAAHARTLASHRAWLREYLDETDDRFHAGHYTHLDMVRVVPGEDFPNEEST